MSYIRYLSQVLAVLCLGATAAQAELVDRAHFDSDAVYRLHLSSPAFRHCDANKDGAFQPGELPCYDRIRFNQPAFQVAAQPESEPKSQSLSEPMLLGHRPDTWRTRRLAALKASSNGNDDKICRSDSWILVRRSKPDVGRLAEPICAKKAIGAEFAWANNQNSDTEVWSANGLVAVPVEALADAVEDLPLIENVTLAPYVSFDRVSNSADVKNTIDNLGYGGLIEVDVPHILGATQSFDLDMGLLSTFSGDMKNWGLNLTWEPHGETKGFLFSNVGTYLPFGPFFSARLSPTIQTGIFNKLGDLETQPIFADNEWVFRSGPAATLAIAATDWPLFPDWAQQLKFEVTYSWLYDWLSGRDYGLLDTAASIGLDQAGHLALTVSYRNGELEETGQAVDLANIGLSVSY